ncbi:hypothetical protein [Acetobacter orientalis]|uniref:hypothetical protein n=1 Tax=Acetobacter orientalis TaxID=146474 RepID=UPI0039E808F5
MQDQAVAQSLSDTNEPTSMPHGAASPATHQDPIARLDRALQRISFALEKGKQTQQHHALNTQELVANVDALICRVRDTLAQTAGTEEK